MSLQLRLRLALSVLLGVLLVVSVGAALQFREIATLAQAVLEPENRILSGTARMHQLLDAAENGDAAGVIATQVEAELQAELDRLRDLTTTEAEADALVRVTRTFRVWSAADQEARAEERLALRDAVAGLDDAARQRWRDAGQTIADEATTAAVGLGIIVALVLIAGAWMSRAAKRSLLDRLAAIDGGVEAISQGESTRRLGLGGDDELSRVAAALDRVLDLRDRTEAAMQGRNRELRALLVGLLHHWPRPLAITGIDGEIIASTLTAEQEEVLRSLGPEVRSAARTLLSRKFLTAAELSTDLRIDARHVISIRALALGEQRIVGWLALFGPSPTMAGRAQDSASHP